MQLHFPLPPSSVIGLPMSGDIEQHHGLMAMIAVVSVHMHSMHVARGMYRQAGMQSMHSHVAPALFSLSSAGPRVRLASEDARMAH